MRAHIALAAAGIVAASVSGAQAHEKIFGCHGQELVRRAAASSSSAAATAASASASSTDPPPGQQCVPKYNPLIAQMQPLYPEIWQLANLSKSTIDKNAVDLYHQIQSQIPNMPPKGTPQGHFTATATYPPSDPDCWWSYAKCLTPKIAGIPPDVSFCPEPRTWGLTIDDGPNCTNGAYYDFLKQHNQKATMFYIGSNVLNWPDEGQRGLADGHEICAHTWSHPYMTGLTNEQAFAELYFSKKVIKDVLGVTVQCWRPPYGDVDDRIRFIANALGLATVIWTHDTFDYTVLQVGRAAIENNYRQIIQGATNGSYDQRGIIVLTHELDANTMALSEEFLPQIQKAFSQVTPVAVCLNNSKPYVEENAFTYPNYAQWVAGTHSGQGISPTISPNAPISVGVATAGGRTTTVSAAAGYGKPSTTSGTSGSKGSSSSAAADRVPIGALLAVISAVGGALYLA